MSALALATDWTPSRPAATSGLSPRAAFQEVVALGAVLVDVRPAAVRAREGEVASWLPVWVAEPGRLHELAAGLRASARVVVLASDDDAAAAATEQLRRAGVVLEASVGVDGGFAAWRSAGMPVEGLAA